MQTGIVKMKSLSAIAGLLLSALVATGCAVDDPPGAEDDQLADSAGDTELQDVTPTGATVDVASLRSANQLDPGDAPGSARSGITANACRTTCRDVVHPELCLFIPFPFCLIPQHECNTLCDVP